MTDSTAKRWLDCCTAGTIYIVQVLCWLLALYLLFSTDHTCPCNDEICCRNLVTDNCPPNHCFCMPTSSILEEEGQCVHDIRKVNGTRSVCIVLLFLLPFFLHFFMMIFTCCTTQTTRPEHSGLLPVSSSSLDSSSNAGFAGNET